MNKLDWRIYFLVCLFYFSVVGLVYGQNSIILTKDSTFCPLGKRIEILEDKTNQLTFKQILLPQSQQNFKISRQETPFHGYSLSSYWFRFKTEARQLPFNTEWFLQLHNPNIDTIEVYFLNEKNELIQHYQTGDRFPVMQRPVTYYKFLFPLPFEKAEKISVYICLRGYYIKNHNLDLVEKKTLLNFGQGTLVFYIFLKAILFALLLYNFLLFLSIRDIAYLYYVGYLFFGLLYFLAFDGFAVRFIYPTMPFLSSYTANVASVYFVICLLWFVYYFLHIEEIVGVGFKKVIWGLTILGNGLLLLVFLNIWQISGVSVLIGIIYFFSLGTVLACLLGILALQKKSRPAIFFALASGFLFMGVFITLFRRMGFAIPEIIGENSFQVGVVMESILLSFALADRIKIADKEKRKAQLETIEALRKNESIIKEQNFLLEQKVKERTAEIEEQKEEIEQQNSVLYEKSQELEQVNATKDKLFAIIGHDLRSPINSLKSLMDLLANQYISNEEFVMFSSKLRNGVEHAHFTLNNLLEWANSQMQGLSVHPEISDLYELGEENINLLTPLASAKQIQLINQIQAEANAFVDADQINLVFRNLISNAIKFTPEGGSITLESKNEMNYIEIAISDTGIGMSAENVAKLFHKTTHFTTYGTANEKGTGLGLLLCQEMVEKNGGKIWVESELGKGTTFRFSLPINQKKEA